jgi:hypothetical protein
MPYSLKTRKMRRVGGHTRWRKQASNIRLAAIWSYFSPLRLIAFCAARFNRTRAKNSSKIDKPPLESQCATRATGAPMTQPPPSGAASIPPGWQLLALNGFTEMSAKFALSPAFLSTRDGLKCPLDAHSMGRGANCGHLCRSLTTAVSGICAPALQTAPGRTRARSIRRLIWLFPPGVSRDARFFTGGNNPACFNCPVQNAARTRETLFSEVTYPFSAFVQQRVQLTQIGTPARARRAVYGRIAGGYRLARLSARPC